jgi:hypothetical protein
LKLAHHACCVWLLASFACGSVAQEVKSPPPKAAQPSAAAKPSAEPSAASEDDEFLEFLGSVDSGAEDDAWMEYLAQTDVGKVARAKKKAPAEAEAPATRDDTGK